MLRMSNIKFSQFVVKLLQPLINNSHIVKDGYYFIKDINQVIMKPLYIMASFAVESLFINIPVQETIDIATLLAFPDENVLIYQGFTKKNFIKLLQLCTKDSYFTFNDKLCHQKEGMAMDNPLGPIFADIFIGYYENEWLTNCPNDFKLLFYRRYVDDMFAVFREITQCC